MNIHNYRKNHLFSTLITLSERIKKKSNNFVIIIDKPEDIFYLTNFWGEGLLFVSDSLETKLIVPKLEYSRAIENSVECDVIGSERGITMVDSLINFVKDDTIVYLHSNSYRLFSDFSKKIRKINIIINDEIIQNIRKIKDNFEITKIQKASLIIDRLFEIATEEIKVNRSEEEIQSILVYEAMKLGARFAAYQFTSNPLIVASGYRGSLPHAETSSKKIKDNEMIVVDITLSYEHYISDATRTFGIGKISNTMRNVYETVRRSQEYGCRQINTTNDFSEIDLICRNIIKQKGYGDYFIHSTGHGIGLEVHEPPWIRPNMKSIIKKNMTVTIEPGIYIENKFGVRIEDSICITNKKKGMEYLDYYSFHKFSKDLIIL